MNRRIRRTGPAACVHVQAGSVVWVRFGTLDVRFAGPMAAARTGAGRLGDAGEGRDTRRPCRSPPRLRSPHAPYRSTRRASAAWATPGAMSSATP